MTTTLVAKRLRGQEGSPTLALAAKAKALAKAGKPVLDFTAGEPDCPTPPAIKQAAIAAINANRTAYTPVAGIPELRAAVASDLSKRLGVSYAAEQVIVSCGAKHALYNVIQAVCDPGDEVLVLAPYWVSYLSQVQLAGARPVVVETDERDHFQPDPDRVRQAVTGSTQAIILNSPSNPTGMIIERSRLEALARLALERRLVVISDEIYDQLVFPPHQACSIVQVEPKLVDRTVVVNGVSKTYSMTGWRIGYAAGPRPLIDAAITLQSHSTSNPTSISQYAALEALSRSHPEVPAMVREFQARRDRMVGGLNRLPGLSCVMPQGAFYAWCHIARLGLAADRVAAQLLEDALVAVVPGEAFGSSRHIRLSFATAQSTIDEGLQRLQQWLARRAS